MNCSRSIFSRTHRPSVLTDLQLPFTSILAHRVINSSSTFKEEVYAEEMAWNKLSTTAIKDLLPTWGAAQTTLRQKISMVTATFHQIHRILSMTGTEFTFLIVMELPTKAQGWRQSATRIVRCTSEEPITPSLISNT